MTSDDRFIRGTVNEALGKGRDLAQYSLLAAGLWPMDIGNDRGPRELPSPDDYNGGLHVRRVSRLEKNDLLFRFSDSGTHHSLKSKFSGNWWFDRECLITMRQVRWMENSDFTATARSCLGILHEKNDMKNLVGGLLKADFWCFKGLTGGVVGARQKLSGPLRTDVMQIYVPGGLKLDDFRQAHDNVLTSGIV